MTSGCSLTPKEIRVTLQLYSCNGSDYSVCILLCLQYNTIKRQDALQYLVCFVTDLKDDSAYVLRNISSLIRWEKHRGKVLF